MDDLARTVIHTVETNMVEVTFPVEWLQMTCKSGNWQNTVFLSILKMFRIILTNNIVNQNVIQVKFQVEGWEVAVKQAKIQMSVDEARQVTIYIVGVI